MEFFFASLVQIQIFFLVSVTQMDKTQGTLVTIFTSIQEYTIWLPINIMCDKLRSQLAHNRGLFVVSTNPCTEKLTA